jgi:anti-sigma factor RsiW
MTNHLVPEDLISAYFDGEVTADERRQVEELLESSAEFRQQLDETAKLSGLLHSFPREAAPAGLVSRVQHAIEGLASTPPRLAPSPATPRAPSKNWRREWTAFGVGILATMASLLLVVSLHSTNSTRSTWSNEGLVLDSPIPGLETRASRGSERGLARSAPAPTLAEARDEGTQPMAKLMGGMRGSMGGGAIAADAMSGGSGRSRGDIGDNSPATAASRFTGSDKAKLSEQDSSMSTADVSLAASDEEQPSLANRSRDENSGMANNGMVSLHTQSQSEFLESLNNGDVIVPRIADPTNTVAVVDFIVVDIVRSADELKVLLQKHAFQQLETDDDRTFAKPQLNPGANELGDQKGDRADDLQVVFVRAPGDQLAAAIDELMKNHPDLYRNWAPQLPIELPQNLAFAGTEPLKKRTEPMNAADGENGADPSAAQEESNAALAEAELAVGTLLARNSAVNPTSESFLGREPPAVAADSSEPPTGLGREAKQAAVMRPQAGASAVPGDSNRRALRVNQNGQGYFRVSVQNQPPIPLAAQLTPPVPNNAAPITILPVPPANSFQGTKSIRMKNAVAPQDSRNSRFVKMLIVLKSESSAAALVP